MFCKATLLTVALALLATASPVARTPASNGKRIALEKRSSLTKADGTFDHEKAIKQIVKLKKYVDAEL